MDDEQRISNVYRKIEREKTLINAANAMRQQTNNPAVQGKIDSQIREGRKNIGYLEERMRELQLRRLGQNADGTPIEGGSAGSPNPQSGSARDSALGPPPPPKDAQGGYSGDRGEYGDSSSGGYGQLGGGEGMMPPKALGPPGPGSMAPKAKPNYSKLDLIKYDTPYLGPRIQLMLSQLEFKLSVEKQYKEGIEKMVRLYQIEGDRKSKADAEGRRIESNQKIQLLKQALKRYEDLHVDMESSADGHDDDSINMPNMRKPLTGHLSIRIQAVKDVDHVATGRFSRTPDTYVVIKVEDSAKARTKPTKTDKWDQEYHNIEVEKANEIELTVYDKPGDQPLPIGMLWIRISDIAEEMRRKKIETEFKNSGWVSADKMGDGGPGRQESQSTLPSIHSANQPGGMGFDGASQENNPSAPVAIDAWFALEPVGQIYLSLSFAKQIRDRRPFDIGLNRNGAIRQRKEEVHELYGHKFVLQQFYNIMRCALCGDFLKYAADFCGMSMEVANQILVQIRGAKQRQTSTISNMSGKSLRPGATRPSQPPQLSYTPQQSDQSHMSIGSPTQDRFPPYAGAASPASVGAAKSSYASGSQTSPTQRPVAQQRNSSPQTSQSATAAAAAAAALSGKRSPSQSGSVGSIPYQRASTDYTNSSTRTSMGFAPGMDSRSELDSTGQGRMATIQQQQPPQQSTYNPADYANIGSYPMQPPPQQMKPPMHAPQIAQQIAPQHQQQQQQQQLLQQMPKQPPAYGSPKVEKSPQQPPSQQQMNRSNTAGARIGLDHFNFLAVLGKGNFGKVMLAETKAKKQLYAIKVLKKEFIIENDEVESTRSEKRVFLIANKERHPFLLNLHACFQTETRVYFVMEYISGGDLMLHIQRGQFGTKRAQFYAAEVCLALKYFHENGVIYRDLKLDNILLTLDGHIKIADYGLCKEDMWYGETTSTFCGTPEFMAPEILLDKKYGRAVDWWAFGVLIYQMLLQQSPFRGEDEEDIYDAILADEPLYPIHMPRDSVSILQKLLTREPELRLGSGPTDAQEIMSHAFFRNINWEDIYHKRIPSPFQPQISSATDTSNFDSEFTSVTPVLTPVQSVLSQAMQEEFRGFSYSADFI
ncbi:MAG: Serine/threonine kinase [Trizodia sp. TS-e1964]|nr:MAG: Serine/threonine kinase [Trizodia sp. TS-e1964]